MSKANQGEVGGCLPLSLRRALGLFFDYLCVTVVCSISYFFHARGNPHFYYGMTGDIALPFGAPLFLVGLICTPVPLMFLRFYCLSILRMPTPGELLSGAGSFSEAAKASWCKQVGFAFCQYAIFWFAVGLSVVMTAELSILGFLIPALSGPWATIAAFGGSMLLVLTLSFQPSNYPEREAMVDRFCAMKVRQLTIKEPKITSSQDHI